MSKPKLTPWFDGRHHRPLPDRPGVYQRRIRYAGLVYSKWDGTYWYIPGPTVEHAEGMMMRSGIMDADWRGVAK